MLVIIAHLGASWNTTTTASSLSAGNLIYYVHANLLQYFSGFTIKSFRFKRSLLEYKIQQHLQTVKKTFYIGYMVQARIQSTDQNALAITKEKKSLIQYTAQIKDIAPTHLKFTFDMHCTNLPLLSLLYDLTLNYTITTISK